MENKVTVTYKVWEARRDAGLTLLELEKRSGVSKSMINYIETNRKNASIEVLCMLAVALKTKPEALYTWEESKIVEK